MLREEALHQLGSATFIVERVFSGEKALKQVVVEGIITSAIKSGFTAPPPKMMV